MSEQQFQSPIESWNGPQLREVLKPVELHNEGVSLDSSASLYSPEEVGMQTELSDNGGTVSVLSEVAIHSGLENVEDPQFAVIKIAGEDGKDRFMLGGMSTDESGRKALNNNWVELHDKQPVTLGRAAEAPDNQDENLVSASKLWPKRAFTESQGFSRNHLHVALVDGNVEVRDTSTYGSEIIVPRQEKTETEDKTVKAENSAAAIIASQIENQDDWVDHEVRMPSTEEQNAAEVVTSVEENTEPQDSPDTEPEIEAQSHQNTSESMKQSFDAVTDELNNLASEASPLVDKISGAPNKFNAQVEGFLTGLERNFNGLGDSIRDIRNLLNAAEMGFMFDLNMNPNQPISNSDRDSVVNLHSVVSRVTNLLGDLESQVARTQQEGTHAQSAMAESLGEQTRGLVGDISSFANESVRDVKAAIDEAGSELTHKAFEQAGAEEPEVNEADENHMDNLTHISGRVSTETNHLVDDTETVDRVVSSKLGLNSQDFTRNILNAAQLHPRSIMELSTDLRSVVTKLEMVSRMDGQKGSLHAEIGFGVKQTVERAFEQISRFRVPTTENPDMQSDIGNARNHVKEMADTAVRYVDQLSQFARDSETNM